jgi:hypothetical protein
VTRTEPDGKITVLIDRFDGKPLNAPNDVVLEPAHDPVVRYVAPQQVAAVPEVDRPLGPAEAG